MAEDCNSSTQEAEAGGLQAQGKPETQNKILLQRKVGREGRREGGRKKGRERGDGGRI